VILIDKFNNIPVEKQNTIINAALKVFGKNGYKKASVNDIAEAAGISKSMVFHYFGTKRDLYFYLIELCGNLIVGEVQEKFDPGITDFFDRIILTSEIEMAAAKKYPAAMSFLTSFYLEDCEEVKADIQAILAKGEGDRQKIAFDGTDFSKFKEGVDVKLVLKMLMWITDGFVNSTKNNEMQDYDKAYQEIFDCLMLLKKNLYKEEYLKD